MRRSLFACRAAIAIAGAAVLGLTLLPLSAPAGAAAAPASSGVTWTIQPSPNQPNEPASALNAVSCVKGGQCTAVGIYSTGKGVPEHQFTLALERTGTKWVLERTPSIKGVGFSVFNGVSCTSASSCLAVGFTVGSQRRSPPVRALAERWNGTSWAVQATPALAVASLAGVSCPTPKFCLAVGGFFKTLASANEQPLAEMWNGKSWSQFTAPNPHAENGSTFTGVDCIAVSKCEVTGDFDFADTAQSVFAYRLSGTTWTAQKQVNPAGQEINSDTSVSCTSASACTSVGSWTNTGALSLTERWNGTAWSRQAIPHPPGSVTDSLAGVSCTGAAACTAVGESASNLNDFPSDTEAMMWNGTSWKLAATPNRGTSDALSGVSCITPTTCVAVGSSSNGFPSGKTLVEVSSG
jgi:hypothetical protein